MRQQAYHIYLDFLETAETKRAWNVFKDIPWDKLAAGKISETTAQCVEFFCREELYVPDYSSQGLELVRSTFETAWFQTRWAFEESRHGLVFREYLMRSGLRSAEDFAALEANAFSKSWRLPYSTPREMACYGALQEGATYIAYKAQKDRARCAGDEVLEAIFHLVGRDEAAHGGFYRAMVELEVLQDRDGTIADLAHVLATFKMPGDGLIPNYREKLKTSGAGITSRTFLEHVVWPLLTTLQISRHEMKQALRKHSAGAQVRTAG
jgi:acyl-[acyl-carrier-protein] desaturase